jgi:hypothetical protein
VRSRVRVTMSERRFYTVKGALASAPSIDEPLHESFTLVGRDTEAIVIEPPQVSVERRTLRTNYRGLSGASRVLVHLATSNRTRIQQVVH